MESEYQWRADVNALLLYRQHPNYRSMVREKAALAVLCREIKHQYFLKVFLLYPSLYSYTDPVYQVRSHSLSHIHRFQLRQHTHCTCIVNMDTDKTQEEEFHSGRDSPRRRSIVPLSLSLRSSGKRGRYGPGPEARTLALAKEQPQHCQGHQQSTPPADLSREGPLSCLQPRRPPAQSVPGITFLAPF